MKKSRASSCGALANRPVAKLHPSGVSYTAHALVEIERLKKQVAALALVSRN